jgi:hypothetical protein
MFIYRLLFVESVACRVVVPMRYTPYVVLGRRKTKSDKRLDWSTWAMGWFRKCARNGSQLWILQIMTNYHKFLALGERVQRPWRYTRP